MPSLMNLTKYLKNNQLAFEAETENIYKSFTKIFKESEV